MTIHVKYTGNGAFIPGVPARDMTQEEYRSLTAEQENAVAHSGIYEIIRTKEASEKSDAKEK